MTGGGFGIGPATPEKIGASRALDGAPGILVEHEPFQGHPLADHPVAGDQWFVGVHISQGAGRKNSAIGGDAAPRRDLDTEVAEGPGRSDPEEHEAGVQMEQAFRVFGVFPEILSNALHGHFFLRDLVFPDQMPTYQIGAVPILGGIQNAHFLSVRGLEATGTLHLDEVEIDRVPHPGNHRRVLLQRPVTLNLCAGVIGHQPVFLHVSDNAFAGQIVGKVPQVDCYQVVRQAVLCKFDVK